MAVAVVIEERAPSAPANLSVEQAGFLGYILYRSISSAWDSARPQVWSLVAVVGAGLVMLLIARFGLRSVFFRLPRESESLEPG